MELSGQVVITAIEANPELGNVVLSAIPETSQTEQLAILNRVSFVAKQQPQSFGRLRSLCSLQLQLFIGWIQGRTAE